METDKCKVLLCAIETGSISAAAEKMGYTPSGISRSIAALEEDCGFPLLIRGKTGVSPTRECEALLPDISALLGMEDRLSQKAALIRGVESGTVRVGTAYPVYNHLLAEMIVSFRQLHPNIKISLTEGTSTELCRQLNMRSLDLCIVSKRENIPVFSRITTDNMMMWTGKNHPAAQAGVYHVSDLKNDNFIEIYPEMETDNTIFLQKHHIKTNVCASTSDISAAFSMVEAGLGVVLINRIHTKRWEGDVAAVPLDIKSDVEIGIASLSPEMLSPATAAFLKFIEKEFKKAGAM